MGWSTSTSCPNPFLFGHNLPGVFFAEDRKALDILCARNDVDKTKIGCAAYRAACERFSWADWIPNHLCGLRWLHDHGLIFS
jgi:hypothetical protein